ncbi:MAG TPA: hypothetical protein PLE88_12840, partial [Anaerohalosphaeraceae bacterium]|nr:hypothetical protein [Anaerohalosphaeraceae bacterium]
AYNEQLMKLIDEQYIKTPFYEMDKMTASLRHYPSQSDLLGGDHLKNSFSVWTMGRRFNYPSGTAIFAAFNFLKICSKIKAV